jgi:hypothetical protein
MLTAGLCHIAGASRIAGRHDNRNVIFLTRRTVNNPNPALGTDNPSSRYQPLRFCLSAIPTCRYLPLLDIAIHALHNAPYQILRASPDGIAG